MTEQVQKKPIISLDDVFKHYKMHKIIKYYLKHFFIPDVSEYKYIICGLEIFHVFIILILGLYIFAPPTLLPYFIMFHISLYIHWLVLKNCLIEIIANKLMPEQCIPRYLPFAWSGVFLYSNITITLSLLFYFFPHKSPFIMIHWLVNKLYDKYCVL
jgi:hypothetical protein